MFGKKFKVTSINTETLNIPKTYFNNFFQYHTWFSNNGCLTCRCSASEGSLWRECETPIRLNQKLSLISLQRITDLTIIEIQPKSWSPHCFVRKQGCNFEIKPYPKRNMKLRSTKKSKLHQKYLNQQTSHDCQVFLSSSTTYNFWIRKLNVLENN